MRYHIENKAYEYYVGTFSALEDAPHIHSHLEMIYLTQGNARAAVDGIWYPIQQGDLFLAGSNQIHRYSHDEPVRFYLIIFTPEMEAQLNECLKGKLPQSHVIQPVTTNRNAEQLLENISVLRKSEQLFTRLEAKGLFLSFLGEVLPGFHFSSSAGIDHDSVQKILAYCSEHFTEPITLESVASGLHLSKYYISHIFRQRMDLSFTEFLNEIRIDHACKLLRQGYSVTDTAFGSGYSSIRTFNRTFKQITGCSPREFRQK